MALLLALAHALSFTLMPSVAACIGDSICLNARSDKRTRLLLGLVVAAWGAAAAAVSLVPAFDRRVHLAALASACVCVPAATVLIFVTSNVGR